MPFLHSTTPKHHDSTRGDGTNADEIPDPISCGTEEQTIQNPEPSADFNPKIENTTESDSHLLSSPQAMLQPTDETTIPAPVQTMSHARISPYPLRSRQPGQLWYPFKSVIETNEPNSYTEVIQSPDANMWKIAILDEYESFMVNKTWSIAELPQGRTPIKSRWVF